MATSAARPLFNPDPQIQSLLLADGQSCYVVDDVLSDPHALVAWADARRAAFQPVDFNAYPGNYLLLPAGLDRAIESFFLLHMRPRFNARRLQQIHARLSMVTLPPQSLRPAQWLCHSDHFGLSPAQSIQASVLYLFHDERLGGTGFYAPARPRHEIEQLFNDAVRMPPEAFRAHYDLAPGYMLDSGRYFERIGGVAPRWNRMVFYDGATLHSGDISAPELLSDDPQRGRLTLNGFYTCRRHAL